MTAAKFKPLIFSVECRFIFFFWHIKPFSPSKEEDCIASVIGIKVELDVYFISVPYFGLFFDPENRGGIFHRNGI
jgi:hypothetical protein